MSKILTLIYM